MTEKEMLDLKIKEYYILDRQKKFMEARLEQLKKEIKASLIEEKSIEDMSLKYNTSEYKAILQIRVSKPEVDQFRLADMVQRKGIWEEVKKEIVDPLLVEQLYLQGKLNDNDLREVRRPSKITTALHIEEI